MSRRIIQYDFTSADELYSAYMPFLVFGGVFIATKESFSLGEEVVLDMKFMEEPERIIISGAVAWITPVGAAGGKPAGIGVQFEEENSALVINKIETYLAGMLHSSNPTSTM